MAKMFFGERHDRVTRDQIELSTNEADSLAIRMLQLSLEIKSSRPAALAEGSLVIAFNQVRPGEETDISVYRVYRNREG